MCDGLQTAKTALRRAEQFVTDQDVASASACLALGPSNRRKHRARIASLWHRLAAIELDRGNISAATAFTNRGVRAKPSLERLLALGALYEHASRLESAATAYCLALRLSPRRADAYYAAGYVMGRLRRPKPARAAFRAAIALAPTDALAYRALAMADSVLEAPREAAAALRGSVRLQPSFGDAWFELGVALQQIGAPSVSLKAYRAALALAPAHFGAHANRGTVLRDLSRAAESAQAYYTALELAPASPELSNNLALLYSQELGQPARALRLFASGRSLAPSGIDWDSGEGVALAGLRRYEESSAAYGRALARDPASADRACQLLLARRRVGDWRGAEALLHKAVEALSAGGCAKTWNVLFGLALPMRTPLLRAVAEGYASRKEQAAASSAPTGLGWTPTGLGTGPLRVGYVSADFRWHVMSFLTRGLVEEQAASDDVDAFAFAICPDDGSHWRRAFVDTLDSPAATDRRRRRGWPAGQRFVDLSAATLQAASTALERARVHILVDLNGYTTDERAEIFAARPAPVSLHAVGFPGTMGARFVPYMLLDRAAAPASASRGVDTAALPERLVLMPHCYQVNDHRRFPPPRREADAGDGEEMGRGLTRRRGAAVGGDRPSRRAEAHEAGRGGPAMVNFNQAYKISPTALALWCGVLARAPRSSLWLLRQPADAEPHLRDEFGACGLSRGPRLQVAPLLADIEAHLLRTAEAELAVDTPEYNCHTTGSDALWSGVPLLTVPGEQMASRVAGSLARASGMLAGVVHSLRQYEDHATQLVRQMELSAAAATRSLG